MPSRRDTSSSDAGEMTTRKPASGWCGATHLHDRYPVYLGDSARSFLWHPCALSAWVAERDNTIVGDVALHPDTAGAVMTRAPDRLNIKPVRSAWLPTSAQPRLDKNMRTPPSGPH